MEFLLCLGQGPNRVTGWAGLFPSQTSKGDVFMSISFQISIPEINMNCFLIWLNNVSEILTTLKSYHRH